MGTTIDAVATSSGGFLQARSARKLANAAAEACTARAGLSPSDIDLLINAGLYREHILGEPALAALIQEDIGANPEDPYEGGHGTFSFDVANGACGVLTGLQIADGFVRTGTVKRALVVASDANPGLGLAPGFPFTAAGGAVLCGPDDDVERGGLVGFHWEVWPDEKELFTVHVGFERNRNRLQVLERPGFDVRAAACAADAAAGLLGDHGLTASDVDLVIANPVRPDFLGGLAENLGVDEEVMVWIDGAYGVHTAGLIVALEAALTGGRIRDAHRVLLVSAGAGVTAGAALWLR
jgi:3-oxoacyl-[acyl-carrier-protein] synthase-3